MLMTEQNAFAGENEAVTKLSKILVPIEFSDRCADFAGFAVSFARRFHAKVTLLHVEKSFEVDPYGTIEDVRRIKEQMISFLPQSVGDPNVRLTIHVSPDVADEILSTAVGIRPNLIVMPTHGYGRIRRALIGSITDRVLRDAPCPVWTAAHTVPIWPAEWLNPRRILCAVDSLPEGSGVLSWASHLASELNVELCVAWSEKSVSETRREIESAAQKYQVDAETVIESKNTPATLRRAVEEMRAELLVVGRNAWKSSAEARSDIYQIIREAPCPVVSI